MEAITLKTKVYATSRGQKINNEYRLVVFERNNKMVIAPQHSVDGNEFFGLPAWSVESMLNYEHDEIYIDMGQDWKLHNIQEAMDEVREILSN